MRTGIWGLSVGLRKSYQCGEEVVLVVVEEEDIVLLLLLLGTGSQFWAGSAVVVVWVW